MRKRLFGYIPVFLIFYLLDAVIVPVRAFGVGPCFLLPAVVCLAVTENERWGSMFGLAFGLLLDFASSAVFGMNALLFMIIGYLAGITVHQKVSVSFLSAVFITAVSAAVSVSAVCLLHSFFSSQNTADVFLYIALPRILLTIPAVIFTYPVFRFMGRLIARREERENIW